METFQHFCDVFVPCYKIVILNSHYHKFNIVLYRILLQKLNKKLWGNILLYTQANHEPPLKIT
jgi:hypothetical protein